MLQLQGDQTAKCAEALGEKKSSSVSQTSDRGRTMHLFFAGDGILDYQQSVEECEVVGIRIITSKSDGIVLSLD